MLSEWCLLMSLPPTAKADELPACYRCEQRAVVEREFQTAIEACIDIAQLLIAANDAAVPATNAASFARLGDLNILSGDTAEIMQNAAGFRNVLAHQYGHDIDDEQVYRHLQSAVSRWSLRPQGANRVSE